MMDQGSQRTVERMIAALATLLPENVSVRVGADGVTVYCDGEWMGTDLRTFTPGAVHAVHAGDLECVLDSLQDHVVHCVWGYWPEVSGSRGVLRVRAAGKGFRILLEFEDAETLTVGEFEP